MALVKLYTVKLRDEMSHEGTVSLFLPAGATLTDVQTFSDALLPLLDAVIAPTIENVSIQWLLAPPAGLKAVAGATGIIERGANLGFEVANSNYRHTIRIPGISSDFIVGDLLNASDTDVAALITAISEGSGTAQPLSEEGNDLEDFIEGAVTFRRK
jgi:hypothetical protein